MPNVRNLALALALCTLLLIALGAALTSEIRPLPGSDSVGVGTAPLLDHIHKVGAIAVAVLIALVALRLRRPIGFVLLGVGIAEAGLGSAPQLVIVHAILAPLLFALAIAIAVLPAEPTHKPATKADLLPSILLLQIGLGAAYRHNAMGVIWHIMGAMIVLVVTLIAGVLVLRDNPRHAQLRPAALALLISTGVQVLLGFTVFLLLLISTGNNTGIVVTSVTHVVTGALTLAAAIVFSGQVRRFAKN